MNSYSLRLQDFQIAGASEIQDLTWRPLSEESCHKFPCQEAPFSEVALGFAKLSELSDRSRGASDPCGQSVHLSGTGPHSFRFKERICCRDRPTQVSGCFEDLAEAVPAHEKGRLSHKRLLFSGLPRLSGQPMARDRLQSSPSMWDSLF